MQGTPVMTAVKLRSLRASVLCVGDARLVFMPGEIREVAELTPGLEQAITNGWVVREGNGANAPVEETGQPELEKEEGRTQSGETITHSPDSADAPSLFSEVSVQKPTGKGSKKRGGEHGSQ